MRPSFFPRRPPPLCSPLLLPRHLLPLPRLHRLLSYHLPRLLFTNRTSFFLPQRLVGRGHGPDGCGGGGAVPRGGRLEVSWFVLFFSFSLRKTSLLPRSRSVLFTDVLHSPPCAVPSSIFQDSMLMTLCRRYVVRLLGWARASTGSASIWTCTRRLGRRMVCFSLFWYSVFGTGGSTNEARLTLLEGNVLLVVSLGVRFFPSALERDCESAGMSFMISCLARSSFAWFLALAPPRHLPCDVLY
jgi:hypothetical protein